MFVDRDESESLVEITTPSLVTMFPRPVTMSALSRMSLVKPSPAILFSAEAWEDWSELLGASMGAMLPYV